jgi:Uma2 family endonuclease
LRQPDLLDGRQDILLNPTVIFEVLSPSTADFDRGFKFVAYAAIPSLQQYVLIASDRPFIEIFTRNADGLFGPGVKTERIGDAADLASIGCRLPLADVYERVEFPAAEASA